MINNTVKTAQYKLSMHKSQGVNSDLSIFEVAQLMDAVRNADQKSEPGAKSVFFSMN